MRFFALLPLLLLLLATSSQAQVSSENWQIIHAGTLLAIPGQASKNKQSVIIKNGKVWDVRDGYINRQTLLNEISLDDKKKTLDIKDIKISDLKDMFVMPGFIDLHVHLTFDPIKASRYDLVKKTDADFAFDAYQNANITLNKGFTTVRNLGSHGGSMFALRDAIKAGKIGGPKILVAGYTLTPTGGHADIHGFIPSVAHELASSGVCDGIDGCRAAVRRQVKRGADVIKVTATGGVLSETSTGTGMQFTQQELNVIAQTAHALGRKVTAHAHAKEGIEAALKAGFDSIEHAMWADESTMRLFKKQGAWLIPTVYPISYVGDTPEKMRNGPLKDLPPAMMNKMIKLGKQPKKMTKLAHEMGVKIALGTDSGVSPHGDNPNEFIEYVNIGMTPMQALTAGTLDAAKAAGIESSTGSLEQGKAADIVAMPDNPLNNIKAVLNVGFVMRDGLIFKSK